MFDEFNDENQYDALLAHLRRARERQEALYEDLIIAHYKGYGATGGTQEEIQQEIDELTDVIAALEQDVENFQWLL
jgi:hypothetical protein